MGVFHMLELSCGLAISDSMSPTTGKILSSFSLYFLSSPITLHPSHYTSQMYAGINGWPSLTLSTGCTRLDMPLISTNSSSWPSMVLATWFPNTNLDFPLSCIASFWTTRSFNLKINWINCTFLYCLSGAFRQLFQETSAMLFII